MSDMKLSGPRYLRVSDDNFELLQPKKSISKKTRGEIVLSRTADMLSMAGDNSTGPLQHANGNIVDRNNHWISLRGTFKNAHT